MACLEGLLKTGPIVINLGLQDFAKSVQDQGGSVIHVDWTPPPAVDEDTDNILNQLL